MSGMDGMHGDWQFVSGEEVETALERGGKALEAAGAAADHGAEDDVRAVGGEGAVELEATAPGVGPVETVEPISEADRDALRGRQEFLGSTDVRNLVSGPDGQMISGHNR